MSIIFTLLSHNHSEAQTPTPTLEHNNSISLHDAYKAYNSGDFSSALKTFEHEHKLNPNDLKISQALGSTLYKLDRHEEAKQIFDSIAAASKEGKVKFDALYNSGNSSYKLGDYKSAIEKYKSALSIKPADQDTEHNLNQAQIELKRVKPTPTPTPTPSANQDKDKKQEDQKENEQDQQNKENQEKQESSEKDQSKSGEDSSQNSDKQEQEQNEKDQQKKEEEQKDQNAESQDKDNKSEEKNENSEKEEDGKESKEDSQKPPGEIESKVMDEKAMKESEAKAWLESLPDAPLLLRRKTSRTSNRKQQTW